MPVRRMLVALAALNLLACTPQPARAPVKPTASTGQAASTCSDSAPNLAQTLEFGLIQLPVTMVLMAVGLPLGALACLDLAALEAGQEPRKSTVGDLAELFPEGLRAQLDPAMLERPLLISPWSCR